MSDESVTSEWPWTKVGVEMVDGVLRGYKQVSDGDRVYDPLPDYATEFERAMRGCRRNIQCRMDTGRIPDDEIEVWVDGQTGEISYRSKR